MVLVDGKRRNYCQACVSSMCSRLRAPRYGRRLIPVLIDEAAQEKPNDIFAFIARNLKTEEGFQTVTYRQFANAINSCAWWLEAKVGTSNGFETLAYFGRSSLLSCVIMIAAIKTGHQVLSLNPTLLLESF